MNLKFEPLTKENINDATNLVNLVFPDDISNTDNPARAYFASIEPERDKDFYARHHLKKMNYFLVKNKNMENVGVTGFYTRTLGPKDMVWLGWYCVSPLYRGIGLGEKILEWTIEKAKEIGFTTMRLYTSTDPNEAEAQILYEKMGFKLIDEDDIYNDKEVEDKNSKYKTLYRERKI